MPRFAPPINHRRRMPAAILAGALAAVVASCAVTPGPPPPPPPPAGVTGPVLPDWRASITSFDRDRLNRLDQAWTLALAQARRQEGSGDLASTGRLIEPDAALRNVSPPPGDYRCRTVKLGSQGGEAGLGYVVYGWFACRIEMTPNGLKFSKLTGSQRPSGLLFPERDDRMILLGSMALASEPPANSYGQRPQRDMVSVLERIEERRWRLVTPWPHNESNLDLLDLVPA
jgi:hypothetical protein